MLLKLNEAKKVNQKIKVAHIVTNFALGGAQDYLITTIKNLDRNKFDIYILGKLEGERVEVLNDLKGIKRFNVSALSREISLIKDLIAIFQIYKLCKKHNIIIVHTHSSKAGVVGRIAAKLAGVKIIVHTIHGFSFHDFMTARRKAIFIFLERLMAHFTDVLLLVSEKEKEVAIKLKIIPRRYIETIYNGVDFLPFAEEVNKISFRKSLGFEKSDFIIGFSGRFSHQKALHILIEAFNIINKEYPDTRLLLVGDGILKNELQRQLEQFKITDKVLMTGFQTNVATYYKIMDIFVMTSLWEGLSRCLAEAMYAKVPVIATDVGGTADAVKNSETGWLINPNSVNEVVESLREAISNPELRRIIGENGYTWARSTFDIERSSKQISDLYHKLITN
jgi:glycosyltransferase involved in cell wall biosynthesis